MRKVVVNTTPLIALSHVGQLELLKRMYDEITIPAGVISLPGFFICKLNRQSIPQTEQSIPILYHPKDFLSTIHSHGAAVIFLLRHTAVQK